MTDIEDLFICKKTCRSCNKSCSEDDDWCFVSNLSLQEETPIDVELKDGKKWYRVTEIKHIFDKLLEIGNFDECMLVCGNTAKGN